MIDFTTYKINCLNDNSGAPFKFELGAYKYVSLIFNGEVNTLANFYDTPTFFYKLPGQAENNIIGDTRNIKTLDQEGKPYSNIEIYNLPAEDPRGLQNFNNDLFVILHSDPDQIFLHKQPNTIMIEDTIPGLTTKHYWIGERRPDADFDVVCPFLHSASKLLYYYVKQTGGTDSFRLRFYINDTDYFDETFGDNTKTNDYLYTNRFDLRLQNTGAGAMTIKALLNFAI